MGGEGDDGQAVEGCVGADVGHGFQPAHHRHLQVHQHGAVGLRPGGAQQVQRLLAVLGDVHPCTGGLQQFLGDLLVDVVVFGQQQAQAGQGLRLTRGLHHGGQLFGRGEQLHQRIGQ